MRTFTYRSWGGAIRTVKADRITFEPGHVAFWAEDGRLVLAEDNANVHALTETEETA